MVMKAVPINNAENSHIEKGISESTGLLNDSKDKLSAFVTILVNKDGNVGFHFTHEDRLSQQALIGAIEEAKMKIMKRLQER